MREKALLPYEEIPLLVRRYCCLPFGRVVCPFWGLRQSGLPATHKGRFGCFQAYSLPSICRSQALPVWERVVALTTRASMIHSARKRVHALLKKLGVYEQAACSLILF